MSNEDSEEDKIYFAKASELLGVDIENMQQLRGLLEGSENIGNQPRDSSCIHVGWGQIDLLVAEDTRTSIETSGQDVCFVIFGINPQKDVIIGHYYPYTPRDFAVQDAKVLIVRHNFRNIDKKPERRVLRFPDFEFSFIDGPRNNPLVPMYGHFGDFQVQYDRKEGLQIIPGYRFR